jgi:4-methyl-5(b-hydroxyethyl)-thiazole monophosphate biosynthesis
MGVLVFLAEGFEEIEALTPVDVLRRAGIETTTVAVTGGFSRNVEGSHGIVVRADVVDTDLIIDEKSYDMIILPGGMPGTKNLDSSAIVDRFVRRAYEGGKYIAAICAAPMILGRRGILNTKKAVCYPGFEEYLRGATITDRRVEKDGRIITACGMGAALEFALEIVKTLEGQELADRIAAGVIAP